MEIIVYKSNKILELWVDGQPKESYPIAIGQGEIGHKEREGDMKTPEGTYVVCVKNPKSKYHLSLGLNYPNNQDAKVAQDKGQISTEEYKAICKANDKGEVPSWKTALGGEVFIHGHLEKKSWTEGCVRMNDRDIESLYHLIPLGTKVTIYP